MKKIGYAVVQLFVSTLLWFYFKKTTHHGLENIPKNKPVIFLSNHQNAFLDTILIATNCRRKPYFLTRSDVFKNTVLKGLFSFFKMIPIYRIRDGFTSLQKNQYTFDFCSSLLDKNEALVVFPEGNHNLKRKVRPLSKGFIRIIFNALEANPELDIYLVPVGVNYQAAKDFPDSAALYYGTAISVKESIDQSDINNSVHVLKNQVFKALKNLTTHIEDEAKYDFTIQKLEAFGVDYTKPKEVNDKLLYLSSISKIPETITEANSFDLLKKWIFMAMNFPVILVWNLLLKPKIKDLAFLSTFRFAYAVIIFPIYYTLLVLGTYLFTQDIISGLLVATTVFLYNLFYTKTI
ncbi:lysophospholipid acyltransferase family protein [Cellulophaga sp. HaHa_2_1]|uniref:lysophospholipid acyltransferase family protein n=1 Tax=Cellulophaga sp. HaHa_2_1 TaxID=2749994 RepID=UPI001C4EA25C|nr:lysophospholipid acyltransferase family protein [Cellulophaga sp. HaHa_2_1]QXP53741.1 1-acyl-sn-glycerol-3-phosphate acyltransferase [Cellulophaga sp. HaHa_2_1]